MVVNGDATCDKTPVVSLLPPVKKSFSSPNGDICCCSAPIGIRLLPAGDELMQPPSNKKNKKIKKTKTFVKLKKKLT